MKIQLVNNNNEVDFNPVLHARVAGQYYPVTHPGIVKVNGKWYDKESPLIRRLYNNNYALAVDCIEAAPSLYFHKNDPDFVEVDGAWYYKEVTVEINGKMYLKSDDRIVPNKYMQDVLGDYVLKADCIQVQDGEYIHKRVIKELYVIDHFTGFYIPRRGSKCFMNKKHEIVYTRVPNLSCASAFYKFENPYDPNYIYSYETIDINADDCEYFTYNNFLDLYVHPDDLESVEYLINAYKNKPKGANRTKEAVLNYNKACFAEADDKNENNPRFLNLRDEQLGGNDIIYNADPLFRPSKSFKLTGGKKYTFGVEVETSAGWVPKNTLQKHELTCVGDRSCGAGEYVTGVLHGDRGIELLKKQVKSIARNCTVDNRCSVHVHIGGVNFTKYHGIYAVKLGASIEEDLYKICPPSRTPDMKYCHGIKRYEAINLDNYKDWLGAFIFGNNEYNMTTEDIKNGKFRLNERDRRLFERELFRWCAGRYKWLNLVNMLTVSRFDTLEIRIFAGSTNFTKIYNYVLMSMAFMWCVENAPGPIMRGEMTLKKMISLAYKRQPALKRRLVNFINMRTNKFNRTNIYKN
jgi:hypothetical protein